MFYTIIEEREREGGKRSVLHVYGKRERVSLY